MFSGFSPQTFVQFKENIIISSIINRIISRLWRHQLVATRWWILAEQAGSHNIALSVGPLVRHLCRALCMLGMSMCSVTTVTELMRLFLPSEQLCLWEMFVWQTPVCCCIISIIFLNLTPEMTCNSSWIWCALVFSHNFITQSLERNFLKSTITRQLYEEIWTVSQSISSILHWAAKLSEGSRVPDD